MEFLGVGPTEFLFIVVIALIVLGPKDLEKTGRTVGKWLNNVIQSDTWKAIKQTYQEMRQLPTKFMREDNFERHLSERDSQPPAHKDAGTWSGSKGRSNTPRHVDPAADAKNENTIQPPITVDGPPADTLKSTKKKPAGTPRKKATTAKKKSAAKTSARAPRKRSNA